MQIICNSVCGAKRWCGYLWKPLGKGRVAFGHWIKELDLLGGGDRLEQATAVVAQESQVRRGAADVTVPNQVELHAGQAARDDLEPVLRRGGGDGVVLRILEAA